MGIGDRLRELREAKHLNQEAFGALGGVSIKTQNRYEMGGRKPTFDYLEALAAAGVDVVYLLTGDRDPQRLSDDEQAVLGLYNGLEEDDQFRAMAILEALRKETVDKGTNKRIRKRPESDL